MNLRTRRDIIRSVPARWREQYPAEKVAILRKLEALYLDSAPRSAVDKIIGNDTWTRNECDCCGKDVDAVVVLPSRWGPHADTSEWCLCLTCLRDATDLAARPAPQVGR